MKKIDNSRRVNNKLISAIAILLIVFLCVGVVFAAVTYINAKGKIELISIELDAESEFSYTEESTDLAFTFPGEQKEIQIKTTNKATPSVLRTSYSFALSGDSDSKLPQAVLVYFNGDYVGTLKELTDGGQKITGSYVGAGNGNTATDTFTLELHLGADGSVYDGKTLALTTSAYTETADYIDTLFVSTTAELNHAIDDINSGLFPDVKIVLLSDVAFGSNNTIEASCTIDLNGRTLSGEAVLDGANACLNVIGKGGNTATYTLTQYDETAANALLLSAAQTALQEGVKGGAATDLFGHLKFYAPTVTVSGNATYENGILTAASVTRSAVETLTIGTETVEFTILDTATALTADSLKNIPDGGATIVTSDLYLPASIKSEGASIEWTSSDQSVMDASGRIIASHADKAPVTLYATINVNGTVTTKSFSFLVSAHTNEINFYKLVATVSPVILYEIGSVSEGTGLYQLPIVDNNSDYDYRKDYVTPEKTAQTGESPLKYEWTACPEIFLTDLSYSLLTKDDEEIYSYIGMEDSCVYLRQDTLNTYAEIAVSGTFETGETYESRVRIIIATGTDTEVLEEAFNYAQNSLQSIDILKNILATRVESGMAAEKGDFTLPASYTAQNGNTYRIEYSSVSDVVKSIELSGGEYTVRIDPTKFADTETHAVITTKVTWGETSRSKSLYFAVPAAVHTADLGNATIFNTVKYQVFMQLPAAETSGNSGFSTVGATITNSNPDYILLRDILGDTTYKADGYYSLDGDYLYDGAETYDGCKELWLYTAANSADYTDTAARDLAALVNWATGRGTGEAQNAVTNKTALGRYGDTLSNGKEYLNDDEVTVIKTYYCSVTGKSEEDWNALWNRVAERAPGYVIFNSAQLNATVSSLVSGSANDYFKYIETLRWASNESRNTEGGSVLDDAINNLGVVGNYDWLPVPATYTNSTISVTETISVFGGYQYGSGTRNVTYTYRFSSNNGIRWYSSGSRSYNSSSTNSVSKYNVKNYKLTSSDDNVQAMYDSYVSYLADLTDYIAPSEFEAMAAYWLNLDTTYSKGIQFINAFYECALIPTYFTSEGVQILLSSLYSDAKITINGNFKTAAVAAQIDGELNKSGSKLQGKNVPAVVNLEDLSIGISYFGGLTSLYICGNEVLPAFLSEYGLNSALSRMVSSVKNVETLVMQHVADNYVPFVLTDIKKLSELRRIDVSDNHGVTNLSALVNTYSKNYTYVDFSHVNVRKEFQEYALTNLHCDVYYSETENETRRLYGGAKAANAALTYLDELEQIIAEKMFAATEVTDGTTASTVYWRIENGNKITLVSSAGTAVTIDTVSEMNYYISPYYYCEEDFTYNGTTYYADRVYRFTYDEENGVIKADSISVEKVEDVQDAANAYNGAENKTETQIAEAETYTSTEMKNTLLDGSSYNNNEYTVYFNSLYRFYRTYTYGWWSTYYNYLYDNGGTLALSSSTSNTAPDNSLICYLKEEDFRIITGQTTIDAVRNINNTEAGEYYLYFPETQRFLGALSSNNISLYSLEQVKANPSLAATYTVDGTNNTTFYNSNYYIVSNNGTLSRKTSDSNATWTRISETDSYYSLTIRNVLNVTGTGGNTIKVIADALTFGCDVLQIETVTTETKKSEVYQYTEQKYYFDALSVHFVKYEWLKYGAVSRSRSEYALEVRLWYSMDGTEKIYLSDAETITNGIDTVNVSDISTEAYSIPDDTTWNIDDVAWENATYTVEWHKQTPDIAVYDSHVNIGTVVDYATKIEKAVSGYYVQYTGTGSEDVVVESVSTSTSYSQNAVYQLTVSGGALAWTLSNTTAGTGGSGNMDNILDTANTHFSDSQYGNYYGMYYAYNGSTITTANGNTYVQYGVYRLMPNDGNTAFEFVYVQQYESKNIDTVTLEIAGRTEEENKAAVGKIYYITAEARTYAVGFYILDYNDTSGSYYLKSFCDADIVCDVTNYSVLQNYRLLSVSRKNQESNYGGTGNTLQVTITAFVRIDGVEYVRRYSVDIVG